MAALHAHLQAGDRVVIATAAPAWLASEVVAAIEPPSAVVGSLLCRRLGGWVGSTHCRSRAKCEAVSAAGFGTRWYAAYSDSADDLPLLAGADRPYIVASSDRLAARLKGRGVLAERINW